MGIAGNCLDWRMAWTRCGEPCASCFITEPITSSYCLGGTSIHRQVRYGLPSVQGDPVKDIGILADADKLILIMKDGRVVKNSRIPGANGTRRPPARSGVRESGGPSGARPRSK
jgi:hypothetical protein